MSLLWSPEQMLAAFCIVVVGALVQGSVGMGLGLVTVPFLLQVDPVFVPGPILASGFLLSLLMVCRERQELNLFEVKWGVVGRVLGTFIASLTLSHLPQDQAAIAAGLAILLAVGLSLSGLSVEPAIGTLLGAGTVSGIMGTLASVGGPPMALLFQKQKGPQLRATMSGYLLLGGLASVLGLVFVGSFRMPEVQATLLFLPAILIGYVLSRRMASLLDGGYTRGAVLFVSAASSVVLLVRTLG
ncbi:MAG: sulfite exporter TauE/SafE family protein [Anaerolineae bacterium]|nr:sulfite exporter TauE/SafE family protein [Anaerolineae bacterium]